MQVLGGSNNSSSLGNALNALILLAERTRISISVPALPLAPMPNDKSVASLSVVVDVTLLCQTIPPSVYKCETSVREQSKPLQTVLQYPTHNNLQQCGGSGTDLYTVHVNAGSLRSPNINNTEKSVHRATPSRSPSRRALLYLQRVSYEQKA